MLNNYLRVFFAFCAFALASTQTTDATELLQELIDCLDMASSVARLDCYDQLVDRNTTSTSDSADTGTDDSDAPAAAAPAAASATAASKVSQEELFGMSATEVRKSVQEATGATKIDEIAARVSAIRDPGTGYIVISLDNGQVWKQTDHSRLRLSDDDQVTIRPAAFGSFMLRKIGRKTTMRVKRIS